MAALADILSPVWTLSKNGNGQITEGLDAIRQCLDVIITTTKGSDPLRPEFGCDAMKYIDAPINQASPLIVKALLNAISTWETRVTVNKITWVLKSTSDDGPNHLVFSVGYSLTPDLADTLKVTIGSGAVTTAAALQLLTLTAPIPLNGNNYPYTIALTLNNETVYPLVHVLGFKDINALFQWVQTNWAQYGNWYHTTNNITLQAHPQYASGKITMSLLQGSIYQAVIPVLGIGEKYVVSIGSNNAIYSPNTGLFTPGDILNYVNGTPDLTATGTWGITPSGGDFNNDDFNNDFNKQHFILFVSTASSNIITINITTEDM